MTWTLAEVLTATGGSVTGEVNRALAFDTIATDTRRLQSGALFVALSGLNHDGHRFAMNALAQGARAVVVERVPAGVPAAQAIVVADALIALGDLAASLRRRLAPRVIGITGSNGKTTTKDMVAAICEHATFPPPRTTVLKSVGTENNLVGVPLTLLRLTGGEAVAVIEMGMNAPGEIARLVEIADPDVGVVTNVGPVHLAGVGGTMAGVAAAKGEMFAGMRPDAVIAVNVDDGWIPRIAASFPGRRVEFGDGAEVEARAITDFGLDGIAFDLAIAGQVRKLRLRAPGRHNVTNALAAAAATHALGIDIDVIGAGLAAAALPAKRMELVRLSNGTTVLNDSYNANPASIAAGLDVLCRQPGRPLAVLGEMLELGAESTALHEHIGALAAQHQVAALVAVGAQAEAIARGAHRGGLPTSAVTVCADAAAAAIAVTACWERGDVILVKGSRGPASEAGVCRYGSRMAEVVHLLQAAAG